MALECRAPAEAMASLLLWPWLAGSAARGDGHSVLVLPGLVAPDASTVMLRGFLRRQGWRTHGWRQGFNLGPREGVIEACVERIRTLHQRSGRKVSLVGWSLGGVFARELSKVLPQAVRQVITLGSPVGAGRHASNARPIYEFVSGQRAYAPELMARLEEPAPVPCTSVYSRSDGVVHWRASLQPPGALAENIAVPASHTGMGMNPLVLRLVAERLAQPESGWRPRAAASSS
ncbi:esterase/lipase family protein [Aquabacterium sp.]|uniref:esterase/lipase family protein n=1 Tax=Aquabacterium sp. TaxID=1872578 RepID=UPI002B5D02FE|nr:alpha/beta hydrolase [Aquabacterium sp.]HSW04984.1 alpha/beta hydrolase [Aquabacterium sp.]